MLRGSSETKIDEKGRLKVPSDFRKIFESSWGRDVFITSVMGDHALLYPLPVWEAVEARLLELPTTHRVRQRYLERVGYYGQQTRLDGQGRMVIPAKLREAAQIVGDVVVFGGLDHLQLWNRERFEQRLEQEPFTDEDFEVLEGRGI